jgi:hypothetical protein
MNLSGEGNHPSDTNTAHREMDEILQVPYVRIYCPVRPQ